MSGKKQLTIEQVIALRRQRLADRRGTRSLIFRLIFMALVGWLLFTQIFLITQNQGQGMFPSLKDGDLCIAFRSKAQTLMKQRFVRDDIIIYRVGEQSASRPRGPVKLWLARTLPVSLYEKVEQVEALLFAEPVGTRYFGRVVAAEGDVVNISDTGSLIVNGTTQGGEILFPTERRENDGMEYPLRVPEGCVYVLGDYRTNTRDSRDFGPIPLEIVEGKVITILRRRGL